MWDMTSLRSAVVAGSRDISGRIRCALISIALALLAPSGAAAQHFPSDEDLTALQQQVEALESQVEGLGEENALLQQQVANLEGGLTGHLHQYLTGSGPGHNNVLATTGSAVLPAAPLR